MAKDPTRHQNLPILYSFVRCPYAMRARMALIYSGINCVLREVNLKAKPPELLEISPKGTVPVLLQTNGEILEESLDIMAYASIDSDLNLKNFSMPAQKQILSLIKENDEELTSLIRPYKYPDRYPDQSAANCRWYIEKLFLKKYNQMLENQDFLLGKISLADLAIFPFVRQCSKVDEDWFYNLEYQNLIEWVKRFASQDVFKNLVMKKHEPWNRSQKAVDLIG